MTHMRPISCWESRRKCKGLWPRWRGGRTSLLRPKPLPQTQQYSGQYRMAAATMQRAFEQAAHAKAPDVQAGVLLQGEIARGISWVLRA